MTDKISDAEYEALVSALVAKQERRSVVDREIRELQDQIQEAEYTRRGLPTEPGMYWHPKEKWPAYLDDAGNWSDGWGNALEETAGDMDLERVKRVEFIND